MIFNKKFEDITFTDIQEMVDKEYSENQVLDYKREFIKSKDAAKIISAFANTYGGFLILGVEEKEKTNKPEFICGLDDSEKDLESKLVNTTVDSIYPYVACQSKFVYSEDNSKKVMVIKVPESDLTPHGIENNTKWYIKINDQKRPYSRADLDKLDWLRNKREKYVQMRNEQEERIESRMNNIFTLITGNDIFLETLVMPQYPKDELVSFYDFNEFILREIGGFASLHRARFSPRDSKNVDNGIFMYSDHETISYAVACNFFGFCGLKIKMKKFGDPKPAYLQTSDLCENLLHSLMLGVHLLRASDYRGSIIIRSRISEIRNSLVADEIPGYGTLKEYSQCICKDANQLFFENICVGQDYEGHVKSHVEEFIARLLFLYGIKDDLRQCAGELFRCVAEDPKLGYVEMFKQDNALMSQNGKESKSIISQARS